MALVMKDRVKETSSTAGTGTLTLDGPSPGFQAFSAIGNSNTTYYAVVDSATGAWEVGIGTYTLSGTTLSRDTVLESSTGGNLVDFSASAKDVFSTYPAERAIYLNEAGSSPVQNTFATLNATTVAATTATLTNGTVTTSPASGNDLVNKAYVDTLVASGIHFHDPVRVESPINLNATYDNGTAGVGATLTNAGTQVALVIDGITMVVADRVLVYEQTDQTQNGVYVVTSIGSGATNWVLTRSGDTDNYGVAGPDTLSEGSTFFVQQGTTGAGETYTCNTIGTITFGTTNITFAQVSSAQIYSAGTGLTLAGTQFRITNTGTAGTYGSASQVPVFVTNAQGQVTSVTQTAIAIAASQLSGNLDIARFNSGTAASSNTYWRGDGTWSTVTAAAPTTIAVTAVATNTNFKVSFLNTSLNTTGNYGFQLDSSSNFTYNPATNTLNNVVLGGSVTLPTASATSRGIVFGVTDSGSDNTAYGYAAQTSTSSTSMGYDAIASYGYSIALGTNARANAAYTVAIGRLAYAGNGGNGSGNISIGHNTSSQYSNVPATLIGHQVYSGNVSSGDGVVALRGTDGSATWTIPGSGFYVDPITAGTSSNVLYYDTTTKKITYGAGGGGGGSLNDLTDVVISNPQTGQTLSYDGTNWVNAGGGGGGGGGTNYSTVPLLPSAVNLYGSTLVVTVGSQSIANHIRDLAQISLTYGFLATFGFSDQGTTRVIGINPNAGGSITIYNGFSPGTYDIVFQNFTVNSFYTGGLPYVEWSITGSLTANIGQPSAIGTNYFSGTPIGPALAAVFTTSFLPYNASIYSGNYDPNYWTSTQSLQTFPANPSAITTVTYGGDVFVVSGLPNAFINTSYPFGSGSSGRFVITLGISTPV
jgi:hypothetical protein